MPTEDAPAEIRTEVLPRSPCFWHTSLEKQMATREGLLQHDPHSHPMHMNQHTPITLTLDVFKCRIPVFGIVQETNLGGRRLH